MVDAAQRSSLLSAKLSGLIREHVGGASASRLDTSSEFGGGAAAVLDDSAWVLLDSQPERGLGAALAWALRRDAKSLHLVADRATGLLARRAAGFTLPISVWHVEGRTLLPAIAESLPPVPVVPPAHLAWVDTITAAGAVPLIEHGVLVGEVEGLEVCRVVDDPDTGNVRLEVGVGAHDRETFQLLHGDRPTLDSLRDVVQAVGRHRHPGAPRHPLNLLAQERALRARLMAHPELIDATELRPAEPPIARTNLKDAVPCVAEGVLNGAPTIVVCSTGVDLDVVPFAVDARSSTGIERCCIAMPERDALVIQRRIAAQAAPPITIVAVSL